MNKEFSERLKDLRISQDLSGAELGKAIGVSSSSIYFWEDGTNDIKSVYLVKLAKFFGVSTDYLLGLDN